MFAIAAAVVFLLMAFGVNPAGFGMLWLALALLALHLGTGYVLPWNPFVRRNPPQ
jgi:hypothetical protein